MTRNGHSAGSGEIVTVIGAGMAGSEAAWQAANRGAKVRLIEMRPVKMTPAHQSDRAAEIVCSNSFKSNLRTNASGVLKAEMRRLGSIIVGCADENAVPAGEALAVDREAFSDAVTERLAAHPNIEIVREEAAEIPEEGQVIIATGPLTSDALAVKIGDLTGKKFTPREGTVTVSVHPDTTNTGEGTSGKTSVVFTVRDTGEGIPRESFTRIFEKFGQVESRKEGRKMSTGLGLTFCKMAVDAHGGRIWVESELGQGSAFFVALPTESPAA